MYRKRSRMKRKENEKQSVWTEQHDNCFVLIPLSLNKREEKVKTRGRRKKKKIEKKKD